MKKLFTLSTLLLFAYVQNAQTSAGPFKPSAFTNNNSANTASWTATSFTANGSLAYTNPPLMGTSKGINLTNFGFSIPSSATIVGVEATLTYSNNNSASVTSAFKDTIVRLVKGGVEVGNNYGTIYSTTPSTCFPLFTYGSNTDLWGTTLTPADVNAANFGFVLYTKRIASNGGWPLIVHAELNGGSVCPTQKTTLTVYYSVSTGVIESQSSVAKQIYSSGKTLYIKELAAETASLEIFDILGKPVYKAEITKFTDAINLDFLSNGTYLYKVKFIDKEISKKIVLY